MRTGIISKNWSSYQELDVKNIIDVVTCQTLRTALRGSLVNWPERPCIIALRPHSDDLGVRYYLYIHIYLPR